MNPLTLLKKACANFFLTAKENRAPQRLLRAIRPILLLLLWRAISRSNQSRFLAALDKGFNVRFSQLKTFLNVRGAFFYTDNRFT